MLSPRLQHLHAKVVTNERDENTLHSTAGGEKAGLTPIIRNNVRWPYLKRAFRQYNMSVEEEGGGSPTSGRLKCAALVAWQDGNSGDLRLREMQKSRADMPADL